MASDFNGPYGYTLTL